MFLPEGTGCIIRVQGLEVQVGGLGLEGLLLGVWVVLSEVIIGWV